MSQRVSAPRNTAPEGAVTIRELAPRAMFTLRGDLGSTALKTAATGVAGVDLPGAWEVASAGENALLWMSPDELLVIVARAEQHRAAAQLETALAGTHHLAADVSDARVVFELSGEGAALRDVLARLTPADVHAEALPPGRLRRSRLAQVPAAFWFRDEGTLEVLAFRSVAVYVHGLLNTAAASPPSGHF